MEPPGHEWDAAGKILAVHRRFCAVHVQIVRKCHPSLPIFMNALEGTVLASNGAMVDLSRFGCANCIPDCEFELFANADIWLALQF